jgi:hypothetical protein
MITCKIFSGTDYQWTKIRFWWSIQDCRRQKIHFTTAAFSDDDDI